MKEQEEIIKGNALIADALGWEKLENGLYRFPNLYPIYNIKDKENSGWMDLDISEAIFHQSFDWLMPVIKTMYDGDKLTVFYFLSILYVNKIEIIPLWKIVVEHLEWELKRKNETKL